MKVGRSMTYTIRTLISIVQEKDTNTILFEKKKNYLEKIYNKITIPK
jgi:hypothetical protein